MDQLPSLPTEKKGVFKKPETKAELVFWFAVGALVFYFWGIISPFVVMALANALYATILVCVFLVVFGSSRLRRLISYIYQSFILFVSGQYAKRDPIGIRKIYLGRFQEQMEKLNSAITDIRGSMVQIERSLTANREEADHLHAQAQASRRGGLSNASVLANKLERNSKRIKNQEQVVTRLQKVIEIFARYRQLCQNKVEDLADDIKVREQEQREAKAFRKSMSAARMIMKGLPEETLYDQSTAALEADYTSALGQVADFLDQTDDIIKQANFDDQVAIDLMNQKLDTLENSATTPARALAQSDRGQVITLPPAESRFPVPVKNSLPDDDEFRKLFS